MYLLLLSKTSVYFKSNLSPSYSNLWSSTPTVKIPPENLFRASSHSFTAVKFDSVLFLLSQPFIIPSLWLKDTYDATHGTTRSPHSCSCDDISLCFIFYEKVNTEVGPGRWIFINDRARLWDYTGIWKSTQNKKKKTTKYFNLINCRLD